MNKIVSFDKIGYVAATLEVDATTQAYLKANHLNAQTGNVDVNGKNLAVKLGTDGKVGFGAETPTGADALFGIIMAYEMDGFASVQIVGGVDDVPTAEAITGGRQQLVVDKTGSLKVLATSVKSDAVTFGGRETSVVKAATSNNKYASIIL